ncbi:glycoside hydrolase family 9 protein [bacterium]|nr:glycoside hydrolase family 9 protein [bacterium]
MNPYYYSLMHIFMISLVFIGVTANADICINSVGFLPQQKKIATIQTSCESFSIVNAGDGKIVFEGKIAKTMQNKGTDETVCIADFSSFQQLGTYQLKVEGVGESAPFRIGNEIYDFPFETVMKGMYLWRCGTDVSATHNGETFAHGACHTDDAYLNYVGQEGVKKESTKGWHDAGDYNKYIVNAGATVGVMFQAWERFPKIRNRELVLPASETQNKLPDFLDEMKWEIDWVLTMQAPDGSVYHKLSTPNFGGFILPEKETTKRFITPWSSAATADFVAMTAMAARIFKPYDEAYAEQCLEAAQKSYAFLAANPDDHRADLRGFRTGAYQTRDPDDRLWAAAELWETTGDEKYLKDFESRAKNFEQLIDTNWDWGNLKNLGMFTYLLSKRSGKDAELFKRIKTALIKNADAIVATGKENGYGRPLGGLYYWGCNGTVARQCMNLMVANQLSPKPEYKEAALAALGHLFGRNYYCRSFVTGLGFNPPLHPHSRRSGGDEIENPWPGYLVGGGQHSTDWVDDQESYQTNEIAINWNGALVYALAAFVSE